MPSVRLVGGSMARPTVRYWSLERRVLPAAGTGSSSSPATAVSGTDVRVEVTTPGNATTQFTVDRWRAAVRIQGPLGHVETVARRVDGTDSMRITALGDTVRTTFSGGAPTWIFTQSSATSFSWSYEPTYGRVLETNGNTPGAFQRFYYSGIEPADSVKVGSATAPAVRFNYDSYGRVTRQVAPAGHEARYYYASTGLMNLDSIVRIRMIDVGPGGIQPDPPIRDSLTVARFTYDNWGRVVSSTDASGDQATAQYDSINRLRSTSRPQLGETTTFSYDALYLTAITDAANQTYARYPNSLGWDTLHVDPRNGAERFRYDVDGNLREYVNRRGHVVQRFYDQVGRETSMVIPGRTTTVSYDPALRWTVIATPESTDTLPFDAGGRHIGHTAVLGGTPYRQGGVFSGPVPVGDPRALTLSQPSRLLLARHP
jgi:YD repeat-containing protein